MHGGSYDKLEIAVLASELDLFKSHVLGGAIKICRRLHRVKIVLTDFDTGTPESIHNSGHLVDHDLGGIL